MGSIIELFSQIEWKEVVGAISAISFLLVALAALAAVFHVGKIVEALREFQRSRSQLGDLLDAIDRLEGMTPKLKIAASEIEDALAEDISERTRPKPSEQETTSEAIGDRETASTTIPDALSKWQEIRDIWRGVRDQIESIIENLDGRRRRPYNTQNRVSYLEVINMLQGGHELTQTQADAANQMNKRYLQLKSKWKFDISEEDINNFRAWKKVFDGSNAQGSQNGS